MSFQREYAEAYDWVAQQFKDWAFTLTTSILYYNDYDLHRRGHTKSVPQGHGCLRRHCAQLSY